MKSNLRYSSTFGFERSPKKNGTEINIKVDIKKDSFFLGIFVKQEYHITIICGRKDLTDKYHLSRYIEESAHELSHYWKAG